MVQKVHLYPIHYIAKNFRVDSLFDCVTDINNKSVALPFIRPELMGLDKNFGLYLITSNNSDLYLKTSNNTEKNSKIM